MISPWGLLPSLGKSLAISLTGQNDWMWLLDRTGYGLHLSHRAFSLRAQDCCLHLSEGKSPSAPLSSCVPTTGR